MHENSPDPPVVVIPGNHDARVIIGWVFGKGPFKMDPANFAWPGSRRERIQARQTLRWLAATGLEQEVAPWRKLYDHLEVETDIVDEEAA